MKICIDIYYKFYHEFIVNILKKILKNEIYKTTIMLKEEAYNSNKDKDNIINIKNKETHRKV